MIIFIEKQENNEQSTIEYDGQQIHIEETNSFTIDIEGVSNIFEFYNRKDKEDAIDLITTSYYNGENDCYLDNVYKYYIED